MAWLIMNDEIDYPCEFYPTHVLGENKELIPIFLGASTAIGYKNAVGLYVRENDYLKLNHKKAYIFIHNPDAQPEDVVSINWDEIPDQEDALSADRSHMHLWLATDVIIEEATEKDQSPEEFFERKTK